jgi:toluene monooxygenase system ferredoxin subunit
MSWKRACAVGDIVPDALKRVEVEGIVVLITQVGDEYRAIPPMCPHMEEPLEHSGICKDGTLTCTKHLWQWNLLTGRERGDVAERPLLLYETRVDGEELLVRIDEELRYEFEEAADDDEFQW